MSDKCKIYDPPLALYRQTLDRHPTMIQHYKRFISGKGKDLPNWPGWCLCPVAAAYSIATHGKDAIPSLKMSEEIRNIAATYAWSRGKKVYSISPELLSELAKMSLDKLPAETLMRLPDWCPYVALPGCGDVTGFFVHLEWDANTEDTELRIVWLMADGSTILIPLSLGDWDLNEAVKRIAKLDADNPLIQRAIRHSNPDAEQNLPDCGGLIELAINCLLYICSKSADIEQRPDSAPHKHRTPSAAPVAYDVGYRIGRLLRQSRAVTYDMATTGRTGQAKAPHLRRAHWHHYWAGPMEGDRRLILKWIPPIAINMDFDKESALPTIYPVE